MAPLEKPVVPEVYCTLATSPGRTSTRRASRAASGTPAADAEGEQGASGGADLGGEFPVAAPMAEPGKHEGVMVGEPAGGGVEHLRDGQAVDPGGCVVVPHWRLRAEYPTAADPFGRAIQ